MPASWLRSRINWLRKSKISPLSKIRWSILSITQLQWSSTTGGGLCQSTWKSLSTICCPRNASQEIIQNVWRIHLLFTALLKNKQILSLLESLNTKCLNGWNLVVLSVHCSVLFSSEWEEVNPVDKAEENFIKNLTKSGTFYAASFYNTVKLGFKEPRKVLAEQKTETHSSFRLSRILSRSAAPIVLVGQIYSFQR